MKKRWILFAVSIFLSAEGICQEAVSIHNGFLTGNEFLSMTNVSKDNYSVGLLDGMFLAPLFSGSDLASAKLLGQCAEGMSSSQVTAIFEKYLKEHPERWHEQMHVLGYVALKGVCRFD